MAVERQLDSESRTSSETIAESASEWMHLFLRHFKSHFIDASQELPAQPSWNDLQRSTLVAIFRTLEDAGFNREESLALLAEVPSNSTVAPLEWTPDLNARRFQLIDKQIANSLTLDERVELIHLTQAMRHVVESEENLPMEGARELHRKLQDLQSRDQESRRTPR